MIYFMSEEQQKVCNDCNHEESIHDVLREPYGRLCTGCLDGGNNDIHVEIFLNDYKLFF